MQNNSLDREPGNYPGVTPPYSGLAQLPSFAKEIVAGALQAVEIRRQKTLLSEEGAVNEAVAPGEKAHIQKDEVSIARLDEARDLVISFRAAFSGLLVSFVDSAPSEIAVATFKNMNAIATWDMLRATDSTIYITVTSVQVDNMVPNAPFPVAICPFDQPRNDGNDAAGTPNDSPPLLVIGLSFAPRHKSGIVVRNAFF
jgi:hypothetical protein